MEFSVEVITVFMLGGILVGVLSGFPLAYVIGFLGLIVGIYVWEEAIAQVFYLRMYRLMIN